MVMNSGCLLLKDTVIRKELFAGEHLTALVAEYSDEDLEALTEDLGGHDFLKIHAAYAAACGHKGQPTVILLSDHQGIWAWTCLCRAEHNASAKESR